MKTITIALNNHFNQFGINIIKPTSTFREFRFTFNDNQSAFEIALSNSLIKQWTRQSPTKYFPGDPSNSGEESYFITNQFINLAFNFKDKILDIA